MPASGGPNSGAQNQAASGVNLSALDRAMKAYFEAEYKHNRNNSRVYQKSDDTAELAHLRKAVLQLMPPDASWFRGPQGALNQIRDSARDCAYKDSKQNPPVSVEDGLKNHASDYQRVSRQAISSFAAPGIGEALDDSRREPYGPPVPTRKGAAGQPADDKPAGQPAAVKPHAKPAEPADDSRRETYGPPVPTRKGAAGQPAEGKPAGQPADDKPAGQPAAVKPHAKPAEGKPHAKPAEGKSGAHPHPDDLRSLQKTLGLNLTGQLDAQTKDAMDRVSPRRKPHNNDKERVAEVIDDVLSRKYNPTVRFDVSDPHGVVGSPGQTPSDGRTGRGPNRG